MPEVAAAIGLAQTERMDFFLNLRTDIAQMFLQAAREADYLVPQHVPLGYHNSYWTVAMRYQRNDVSWQDFRSKYLDFGRWYLCLLGTFISRNFGDFWRMEKALPTSI